MLDLTLRPGDVFNTDYEQGCVVVTEPDELGNFDALDSDGVLCSFSLVMVRQIDGVLIR